MPTENASPIPDDEAGFDAPAAPADAGPPTPRPLTFSLRRKEEKVVIEDAGGDARDYVVREMPALTRDRYVTENNARFKYDADGNFLGMANSEDLQTNLIHRCLYGPDGKPVDKDVLRRWPATVQEGLYDLCQRLNGLGQYRDKPQGK